MARSARSAYAFLVSEEKFDEIFGASRNTVAYFAEPDASGEGQINARDGGRGCYFHDPAGHWLEIITRPYGSGGGEPDWARQPEVRHWAHG